MCLESEVSVSFCPRSSRADFFLPHWSFKLTTCWSFEHTIPVSPQKYPITLMCHAFLHNKSGLFIVCWLPIFYFFIGLPLVTDIDIRLILVAATYFDCLFFHVWGVIVLSHFFKILWKRNHLYILDSAVCDQLGQKRNMSWGICREMTGKKTQGSFDHYGEC